MIVYISVGEFVYLFVFFFFKQKTAYEMRISDWSSDVCSSDLQVRAIHEIMARLDSLDSMLKDAEAMADEHSKAMARRDLEDSDGAGKGGNARPPVDRR